MGRSFGRGINDHEHSYNYNTDKSKFADNALEEGHLINTEFKILHQSEKGKILNI